jgi:uncharacterized protein (DUF1778 family)
MTTPTAPREVIINLRARALQKELIDRAAELQGKNRTDFMLDAACEKAEQVLLDRTFFALDARHHQRFVDLLDAPTKPNKALVRLLKATAPWER